MIRRRSRYISLNEGGRWVGIAVGWSPWWVYFYFFGRRCLVGGRG